MLTYLVGRAVARARRISRLFLHTFGDGLLSSSPKEVRQLAIKSRRFDTRSTCEQDAILVRSKKQPARGSGFVAVPQSEREWQIF